VRLGPGDVAVLCGGAPYVIADDPAAGPNMVIRSGGRCTTVDGEELRAASASGVGTVGTWGAARPDSTLLLSGLYTVPGGVPGRLLAALPQLAVVEAKLGSCPVGPAAFEEIARESRGSRSCWTACWTCC
jgi:hypothetical protein